MNSDVWEERGASRMAENKNRKKKTIGGGKFNVMRESRKDG